MSIRNEKLNEIIQWLDVARTAPLIPEIRKACDDASLLIGALRFDDPERLAAEISRVTGAPIEAVFPDGYVVRFPQVRK